LNFRGAVFVILSVAKYFKKAEIIPDNLHRIMPAKGEIKPLLTSPKGRDYHSVLPDFQLNFL
jgi:hypothetical protein